MLRRHAAAMPCHYDATYDAAAAAIDAAVHLCIRAMRSYALLLLMLQLRLIIYYADDTIFFAATMRYAAFFFFRRH